ncbi:MAG: Maf family protein [Alphaproteobacteria bacterium]|nr:Maf family protein [Alphaproteobacteria bacterium]
MSKLILASQSQIRCELLKNAGVEFCAKKSNIDERAFDEKLSGLAVGQQALQLAIAKAMDVSKAHPDDYIIGCDQMLEFENKPVHKAKSIVEASIRLTAFSGKSHFLHSAAVLVKSGKVLWQIVKISSLKMRDLTSQDIKSYLQQIDKDTIFSVGCYQIEGLGINLFDAIEGNMFDIMGLPLLELLAILREYNL